MPRTEKSKSLSGIFSMPGGAEEIFGEVAFDAGEAEDGFGIVGRRWIPEAPEIFEHGVAAAVEEGVLKAVGFVAGEAVGDVDHVARLEPAGFADHRGEGVGAFFPVNPFVQARGAQGVGFMGISELGSKGRRWPGGGGGGGKIGREDSEGGELVPVGAV